jgi:hypothetical protein
MRALVISGGGAKAFAGGVAQYLRKKKNEYDILLVLQLEVYLFHLALNKTEKKKRYLLCKSKKCFLIGFLFIKWRISCFD